MDAIGGFEREPLVAVGVSGGADSLALTLLLDRWTRRRGGAVRALTVDHGLRPESAAEADRVGAWLAARGIAHHVLRWEGAKPAAGIQEAARAARRRLLIEHCAGQGILHLALAHHRDDQAETVLMRFARGSGVDGLCGMAPVRPEGAVRLLRPLLAVPHARLVETCLAFAQPWIEDPSNASAAYARGRLRAAAGLLAAEGLSPERLADTAHRAARARRALEVGTAALLATASAFHPEGWATLDPAPLVSAPEELGLRALARTLMAVGGQVHAPKAAGLERLLADVAGGLTVARTLGGCVVAPRRGRLLVAREPDAAAERVPLPPGGTGIWDGRFTVRLHPEAPAGLVVARLGAEGWGQAAERWPELRRRDLPVPVREASPGLWDGGRLVLAPAIEAADRVGGAGRTAFRADALFTPPMPPGGPAFPVVSKGAGII
ncbi:tRNA lysidine(34) synthetase TilS [Azospirillum sp. RWY-5-1]|uniref:tRNA(Ile)-lysidine synthase n=2 Tax=Azospirillum oleiclasticum TaxID=2735135 RepID=A0ABX2TIH5_9PROT|nr:tRNA lysidine(34) synthetase TilS [Azospirillum oleiclasticum]NYZ15145.1 tRNA lysidine(34) synthetase TilS [Azospirillum oleiclasticum]NYZ22908.1 tRNA lysidine(34) synthetase TilS [Azospirillum oleiclasticum]